MRGGSVRPPGGIDTSTPHVSAVIVLAAGQGTRMRSSRPKVMHELAGRPMVWHAISAAASLQPEILVAVIGHGRDEVEAYVSRAHDLPTVVLAVQEDQFGTGHAVASALRVTGDLTGTVVVTYGDVPLLSPGTLASLVHEHDRSGNAITVLTASLDDPTGYGRIVREPDGAFTAIVEHREASPDQLSIDEINSGVYAFNGPALTRILSQLAADNAQGERYLTGAVALARAAGEQVGTLQTSDPGEIEGVNDRVQLATMARRLNDRLVRNAQLSGVTVDDPATTWLHVDVTIGPDTQIRPNTHLEAGTTIGSGCVIGPDTTLSACAVGDGAVVQRSYCQRSEIGDRCAVGPFAHLRAGSVLHEEAEVGAFVQVKQATIGAGVKAHHLAYLGDATIGDHANIGAGAITANYDGVHKSRTIVGDHAFIGSNATLVAPITIGDGAYVAAGSAITNSVNAGDLAVARGHQHNSSGWVAKRRPNSPAAVAAASADANGATTSSEGITP